MFHGRERQLTLATADESPEFTAITPSNFKIGDRVKITIDADKLYFFDKDTEDVIEVK